MRFARRKNPFPDFGIPTADACRVDGDQDFAGIKLGYGQGMARDRLGSAKMVDGRGEHRARDMLRVMPCRVMF